MKVQIEEKESTVPSLESHSYRVKFIYECHEVSDLLQNNLGSSGKKWAGPIDKTQAVG